MGNVKIFKNKDFWAILMIIFFLLIRLGINILFMILGGDCDDLKIFSVSKIIVLIIFVINSKILFKYSRLVGE